MILNVFNYLKISCTNIFFFLIFKGLINLYTYILHTLTNISNNTYTFLLYSSGYPKINIIQPNQVYQVSVPIGNIILYLLMIK